MRLAAIDFPTNELAELCRRYRVKELSVFGSVLRSDFRPDSDVDLLVDLRQDHQLDLVDYIRLQEELSVLMGRPVDLVDKSGLKKRLREEILGTARVLYAE